MAGEKQNMEEDLLVSLISCNHIRSAWTTSISLSFEPAMVFDIALLSPSHTDLAIRRLRLSSWYLHLEYLPYYSTCLLTSSLCFTPRATSSVWSKESPTSSWDVTFVLTESLTWPFKMTLRSTPYSSSSEGRKNNRRAALSINIAGMITRTDHVLSWSGPCWLEKEKDRKACDAL